MNNQSPTNDILYFQITDLWKKLCENHTTLLDLTFLEYSSLLSSDVEELEELLEKKNDIILDIKALESLRAGLIEKLNSTESNKVSNVSGLIEVIREYEEEKKYKHFQNFNNLLIDLIEKLKSQNKKNQMFLNKAIHSLKNIKEDAMGKKSFSTYGKNGHEKNHIVP
jgi:flagellar biosynthesis/type III secretory pathway chaperone